MLKFGTQSEYFNIPKHTKGDLIYVAQEHPLPYFIG